MLIPERHQFVLTSAVYCWRVHIRPTDCIFIPKTFATYVDVDQLGSHERIASCLSVLGQGQRPRRLLCPAISITGFHVKQVCSQAQFPGRRLWKFISGVFANLNFISHHKKHSIHRCHSVLARARRFFARDAFHVKHVHIQGQVTTIELWNWIRWAGRSSLGTEHVIVFLRTSLLAVNRKSSKELQTI